MEFKNDLDLVGKIAAHSVMSGKYKDKDGNIKEILPVGPGNSLDFDQFREDIGAFGGGSGGSTDPDNPNENGANYVPGLLSDGSLTGRKLEWLGTTQSSGTTTAKFNDDLGTKLNLAGDGLQFVPYMEKNLFTRGVMGATSKVPLVYSKDNTPVKGSYVTTQYLPISINKKDLVDGNEVVVIFDGIGENDSSATELTSPELHFKYNSGSNSVGISQVSGYAYDNLTSTKTGEFYSLGISMINTFYTQKPVAQFPSTVQLFSGNANGPIVLSGVDNYYSNVPNGIEVTFDDHIVDIDPKYSTNTHPYAFGLLQTIRIPKEALVIGSKYYFDVKGSVAFAKDDHSNLSEVPYYTTKSGKNYLRSIEDSYAEIKSGQITVHLTFTYGENLSVGWNSMQANVAKVTPY